MTKSSARAQISVASPPIFEHLNEAFGRAVLSAQTLRSLHDARDGEHWFVACTRFNMEYVALVDLHRLGVVAHLALFVEPTARNPSRPGGARKGTLVIRRLFPGYVFVRLHERDGAALRVVQTARGVAALITTATGRPVPVPAAEMAELLERSGERGYEDTVKRVGHKSRFVNISGLSEQERLAVFAAVMTDTSSERAA